MAIEKQNKKQSKTKLKKTSIGGNPRSIRFKSKNDKRMKKKYRGQGRP